MPILIYRCKLGHMTEIVNYDGRVKIVDTTNNGVLKPKIAHPMMTIDCPNCKYPQLLIKVAKD